MFMEEILNGKFHFLCSDVAEVVQVVLDIDIRSRVAPGISFFGVSAEDNCKTGETTLLHLLLVIRR